MSKIQQIVLLLASSLMSMGAMASTNSLTTSGTLYTGLVSNVLNGEIGTVTAIGLVAFGVFMIFRSAAMAVMSLAAAVVFWNAESILGTVLGMTI